MRKLRHEKMKFFFHSHTICKWQNQNLNTGDVALWSMPLSTAFALGRKMDVNWSRTYMRQEREIFSVCLRKNSQIHLFNHKPIAVHSTNTIPLFKHHLIIIAAMFCIPFSITFSLCFYRHYDFSNKSEDLQRRF